MKCLGTNPYCLEQRADVWKTQNAEKSLCQHLCYILMTKDIPKQTCVCVRVCVVGGCACVSCKCASPLIPFCNVCQGVFWGNLRNLTCKAVWLEFHCNLEMLFPASSSGHCRSSLLLGCTKKYVSWQLNGFEATCTLRVEMPITLTSK